MTDGEGISCYTSICKLFGVRYPIVQTGMGWVSDAGLTAATSEAGGLGILAAATLTLEELRQAVAVVKSCTDKPFGVNVRPDQTNVDDYIDYVLDAGGKIISFAAAPKRQLVDRLKKQGVVTVVTIGAPRHAEKMAAYGVDVLIAQGSEGGGHTGQIPTTVLLPMVCDLVDVPVLAAGGFADGRGLVAALAYGADGVAMGTRFLLTQESPVPQSVKQAYLATGPGGTVVTSCIDGFSQRVIRTSMVDQLERAGPMRRLWLAFYCALAFRKQTSMSLMQVLREARAMRIARRFTWAQLIMAANAPMLTRATMVDGDVEVGMMPTGQVVGGMTHVPTVGELVEQMIREAHRAGERVAICCAHQGEHP